MNATNQQSDDSINIIGDGSIGHLLTGYLLKSARAVSLYSRTQKKPKVVTLTPPDAVFKYDFTTYPQVLSELKSNNPTIIAVKAHNLEAICQHLSKLSLKPSYVILMMNGLGLIELCQQWLPEVPVFQAATTQAARLSIDKKTNQATVEHTGFGETLIGDFEDSFSANKSSPHNRPEFLTPIIETLDNAIGPFKWCDNHQLNLWFKLFINSIINPLTTINNVNNGALAEDPDLSSAAKRLAEELSPLIQQIQPELSWRELYSRVLEVAAATAKNTSSMRQDMLFGRKTEIDFITGYILKKAQKFGCSLPNHQKLYQQVKRLENQTQTSVTK